MRSEFDEYEFVADRETITGQRVRDDEREARNNEGGYVYSPTLWDRLTRYLILGTQGGSYYVDERRLTQENEEALEQAVAENPCRLAFLLRDVSVNRRALRETPVHRALLALVRRGGEAARVAYRVMPDVLRTGRQFLAWQAAAEQEGLPWNASRRKATAAWYTGRDPKVLGFQLAKYRSADGMTHRDLLRLAHPRMEGPYESNLARYLLGKQYDPSLLPESLQDLLSLQNMRTAQEVIAYATRRRIPWEFVPNHLLDSPDVWSALLPVLPMMALVRNLSRFARYFPRDPDVVKVLRKRIEHGGAHLVNPLSLLLSMMAYDAGFSARNKMTWQPDPAVSRLLEQAFYDSFGTKRPSRKRYLIAVDVSNSMTNLLPSTQVSAAQAAAALALVLKRHAPNSVIRGFAGNFMELGISEKTTIAEARRQVQRKNFGATDCSLPMLWAMEQGEHFDAFVVLTDSETWAGNIKPMEALRRYRAALVPDAALIVVAMMSNGFTVADPLDPKCLDVVGFDPTVLDAIQVVVET